jgi:hypothetical protein
MNIDCFSAVSKPTISKAADVFGRFEAFTTAILIYTTGYIQQAASKSIGTYCGEAKFQLLDLYTNTPGSGSSFLRRGLRFSSDFITDLRG